MTDQIYVQLLLVFGKKKEIRDTDFRTRLQSEVLTRQLRLLRGHHEAQFPRIISYFDDLRFHILPISHPRQPINEPASGACRQFDRNHMGSRSQHPRAAD